jgi:hypothetical protein
MKCDVPALRGETRFRVAPRIGLKRACWLSARDPRPVEIRRINRRDKGSPFAGDRVALVFLTCLALTGCATTRYSTIYCLSHDQQLPAEPPKVRGQLTGNADKDLTIVAGSAIRLRSWGEGLQTILEGCREK